MPIANDTDVARPVDVADRASTTSPTVVPSSAIAISKAGDGRAHRPPVPLVPLVSLVDTVDLVDLVVDCLIVL
jgi:hypothetical protein